MTRREDAPQPPHIPHPDNQDAELLLPFAKDKHVDAYIAGNRRRPLDQKRIKWYFLPAVILEPPQSWEEFRTSVLSPAQVHLTATAMNISHSILAPKAHTSDFNPNAKIIVEPERFQDLYASAKKHAINAILQELVEGYPPLDPREELDDHVPVEMQTAEEVAIIQAVFDDKSPSGLRRTQRLQKAASIIGNLVESEDGTALSDWYVSIVRQRETLAQRMEMSMRIRRAFHVYGLSRAVQELDPPAAMDKVLRSTLRSRGFRTPPFGLCHPYVPPGYKEETADPAVAAYYRAFEPVRAHLRNLAAQNVSNV